MLEIILKAEILSSGEIKSWVKDLEGKTSNNTNLPFLNIITLEIGNLKQIRVCSENGEVPERALIHM